VEDYPNNIRLKSRTSHFYLLLDLVLLLILLSRSFKKLKIGQKKDSLMVLGIPSKGIVVANIVFSKLKSSSFKSEFDIILPRKWEHLATKRLSLEL
jgi:hypothetical protein